MNEDLLRERLHEAAHDDQFVDPAADLARGRESARRRRVATVGGSVVATAGVVATVIVGAQVIGPPEGPGDRGGAPFADQTSKPDVPSPTPDGSSVPKPDHPRGSQAPGREVLTYPSPTVTTSRIPPENALDNGVAFDAWRNGLYRLAQVFLDPDGGRLNYDTESLQGGSGKANGQFVETYGIKLGWTSGSGDTGLGMVMLSVASPGATGLLDGCGYFGPCETVNVPGRGQVRISGDPGSGEGYAVLLTQADGEEVSVVVDPLFGNNSLTPTDAPLPSFERVLELAESPDFNLPD